MGARSRTDRRAPRESRPRSRMRRGTRISAISPFSPGRSKRSSQTGRCSRRCWWQCSPPCCSRPGHHRDRGRRKENATWSAGMPCGVVQPRSRRHGIFPVFLRREQLRVRCVLLRQVAFWGQSCGFGDRFDQRRLGPRIVRHAGFAGHDGWHGGWGSRLDRSRQVRRAWMGREAWR
jgi:hypothetical protein